MPYRKIPLGAIPSPPDERDFSITKLTPIAQIFPEEFEIPYNHSIKNQGDVGSCVAHSLDYCREIIEEKQLGQYIELSPGFIYADRLSSDYQGSGMYPRQALQTLVRDGVCSKAKFPQNIEWPQINNLYEQKQAELLTDAAPHKITAYTRLNTIEEIKTALINLGPVSIMIPVYESFYKVTKAKPVVPLPDKSKEKLLGYHEMTLLGWRIDSTWKNLNSWGEEWGDGGYCYLPFDFPIIEAWSITDNIIPDPKPEPKPDPQPEPQPQPKPEPKKLWHVQVGAFADKANADRIAEELKAKGYPVYVVQYYSVNN